MRSDNSAPFESPPGPPLNPEIADAAGPPANAPEIQQLHKVPDSLARRITSRTTDLLAIVIVTVASLTIGRQMLRWWHTDPPAVIEMGVLDRQGAEWGADGRPVNLEFGNNPLNMTRRVSIEGGQAAALDAVCEYLQTVLLTTTELPAAPDAAEVAQLEELSKLVPDRMQAGNWQIYILGGQIAAVVGVKSYRNESGKLPAASPHYSQRVLCWGLVFPGPSNGSWTTYTFVRRSGRGSVAAGSDLSQIDLPPGCERTVVLQEAGQAGLLGFHGRPDAEVWKSHFDRSLQSRGWKRVVPWSQQVAGWASRYVKLEDSYIDESTIQIQFHLQNAHQGMGLIHWRPGRTAMPTPAPSTSRGTP